MFRRIWMRLFRRKSRPKFATWFEYASWRMGRISELEADIATGIDALRERDDACRPNDDEYFALVKKLDADALEQICLECSHTCDSCPLYHAQEEDNNDR